MARLLPVRFATLIGLATALSLSGCLFNDCSFDFEELTSTGVLSADVAVASDTLTVAFVDTFDPGLDVYVRAGLDANASPSTDGTVRLGFDAESLVFQNSAPRQFDTVAVGDTVYVYIAGALDPSIFTQTCSPPAEYVRLDVVSLSAPPDVRVIRTVRLSPGDLPTPAAQTLRQRDAHRPTSV